MWSLGITLVELATGQFPYKDCKTEFEVLTKVIEEDPPCLPPNQGFSTEFRSFVRDCLLKNHKDRPKYKKLLEHPFIVKYRDMDVDVGAWYSRVSNHSGDPNKNSESSLPSGRKSSLESQRHDTQTFKPQPSPRMVKSWRQPAAASSSSSSQSQPEQESSSFSRLKFYKPGSQASPRDDPATSPRYSDNPRLAELSSRREQEVPRFDPRTGGSYLPAREITETGAGTVTGTRTGGSYLPARELDSSRLTNGTSGPLSRNNFTSSYHGSSALSFSRPSYVASRSHDEKSYVASRSHEAAEGGGYSGVKSPQASRFNHSSYSETNSPRDYGGHTNAVTSSTHRKYSFETLEPAVGRDYHYTPKGTRKYEGKVDYEQTSPRKYDSSRLESPSQAGGASRVDRRHPNLPVPEPPRGRDAAPRASSSSFMPSSWKWNLSSPLNLRKFRTASSDRASSNFERSRRNLPGYRSLNERDKQFYSSSGKSDNL